VAELTAQLATQNSRMEWTPPPRFQGKTFAQYRIDEQTPGQAEAVAAVQQFVGAKRRFLGLAGPAGPKGCYLDGDFGVGKTHLLASAWHAAPSSKSYLSFAEAINLCVLESPERAIDQLAADLICIDEFELDDPSNTRMADLLCDGLVRKGCRLLVTSNTVPGELGIGRLFVDQFRAQLVRISQLFTDIHVPGRDYRQRQSNGVELGAARWSSTEPAIEGKGCLTLPLSQLNRFLEMTPMVHLRQLGKVARHLNIIGLGTFPDQIQALRFVHLIDRAYDQGITLSVRSDIAIADCFCPEYRDWAFAKKYRRCTSRLTEASREEAPHALSH
jgi:cell division protein ZapE